MAAASDLEAPVGFAGFHRIEQLDHNPMDVIASGRDGPGQLSEICLISRGAPS
jgi:hypothetical protein